MPNPPPSIARLIELRKAATETPWDEALCAEIWRYGLSGAFNDGLLGPVALAAIMDGQPAKVAAFFFATVNAIPQIERMAAALERLSKLTPHNANAHTAADLYLTVRAIAETALAALAPEPPDSQDGADQ